VYSAIFFHHFCLSVTVTFWFCIYINHQIESLWFSCDLNQFAICILQLFLVLLYRGHHSSFLKPTIVTKFPEINAPSAGGCGNFGISDRNSRLRWKRYGPWLLSITNRKSHVADRSMLLPTTFSDLERNFSDGSPTSPYAHAITLRAKLNGAVYCYRSCLWWQAGGACLCVYGCVCLWVCCHDNSKLHDRSSPNWVCRWR